MNTSLENLTHKMQRAAVGKMVDVVLSHADKDPEKTMGQIVDLAKQLNITAPSITSSIRKMEQFGYIARQTDPADQRVMRLALTEKGRSCIQSIKDVTDKMEEILLKGMSVEEKILFRRLLVHVNNNIDQYERKEKI